MNGLALHANMRLVLLACCCLAAVVPYIPGDGKCVHADGMVSRPSLAEPCHNQACRGNLYTEDVHVAVQLMLEGPHVT